MKITVVIQYILTETQSFSPGGGGELPYEEYMGVCHELGSYFQGKIPKRSSQKFQKGL